MLLSIVVSHGDPGTFIYFTIYGLVHFCWSIGFKEYDTHSDPEEMQTNVKMSESKD